jgi:mono/diheme cytochrome c family protein
MKHKFLIGFLSLVVLAFVACVLMVSSMIQRGFSAREKPTVIESSLAAFARERSIPSHYKTMKNPVTATPEVLHEAMAHWADHCATCHANNGSGNSMFGKGLYPRPPDMRQQHTQQLSDGVLYYTIKNGVRLSGMPAFGDPGDEDLATWKLVAFIRHLPSLTRDEELEMEQMNPKTPEEIEEERQEQNFLDGGSSTQPQPHHGSKGAHQE